jgi:hypothetical protein
MKHRRNGTIPVFIVAALFALGLLIVGNRSEEAPVPPDKPTTAPPKAEEKDEPKDKAPKPNDAAPSVLNDSDAIAVAPPPFSKGIFPCSGCHEDLPPNPTPRVLTKNHKNIVLKHDEKNRWCLDCHNKDDRDKLHLAGGTLIDFTESYRLCGQCHGPTLRDWKAGEHGKRTGSWSGKKEYLLCASCHNPHSPRFHPLKPLPPPVRPEDLR